MTNPHRKSVMKHDFSNVPKVEIPRSSFDRSHGYKTAFDGGKLIPLYIDEALPGDTFALNLTALVRMNAPLIRPIMDNLYLDTFFFAVPHRLIWDNWQKFCGEQTDPGDSIDFTIPVITNTAGVAEDTLYDYMGIPIDVATMPFNALAPRAYSLIWDEWFRDENLQDSISIDTDDGPDTLADHVLQSRGKRHDYFTSSLPWPQKGDAVELPLGTSAPVVSQGTGIPLFDWGASTGRSIDSVDNTESSQDLLQPSGATIAAGETAVWNDTALEADLSSATAATINAIRQAFQIQKLMERDARGGTRYTEIVRSHFGVTSPDQRLQRPEYLGGGSTRINVRQVAATAESFAGDVVPGDLSAYATAELRESAFNKSFTEHCIIIGLCSVRADLTYQQGLNRMWSRQTRYDYYWPTLSHIGEQSVLNKEIYAQGDANDILTFGYQERYAEYRYKPSQITGAMRSTAAAPLDVWHLAQDFSALPVLNSSFITDVPPIDRIITVTDEPHFIMDCHFNLRCARPMPMYGVPGMIDHF